MSDDADALAAELTEAREEHRALLARVDAAADPGPLAAELHALAYRLEDLEARLKAARRPNAPPPPREPHE